MQNDPYGLFEYGELPQALFDKWENAHDGYGDFHDLDAATLGDVESFFGAFYRPNNAILAVAGDVSADDVFAKAEGLFGPIPSGRPARRAPTSPSRGARVAGPPREGRAAREDPRRRDGVADAGTDPPRRDPAPRPRRAAPQRARLAPLPRPRRGAPDRDRPLRRLQPVPGRCLVRRDDALPLPPRLPPRRLRDGGPRDASTRRSRGSGATVSTRASWRA